ncbi:MAG TPA: AsmA-like C-terminal domain-containing protein [Rhizomicrobium sp.]
MDDVLTFLQGWADACRRQLEPAGRFLRPYRGHLRLTGLVIAGIFTAIVFFVVGAMVRVLIGPVSLGPFNGQIAQAISESLPGLAVGYDQAAIEWSREEHRVNLVVLGARVLDSQQRIIAQAPKAEVDLAAGPFLHGRIEVKRISLVGMQLTLVRTKTGSLRLGVERNVTDNDVLDRIRDAISKAKGGPSSLESFAIKHARLAFYDEGTGAFLVSPDANIQISTGEGAARASNTIDTTVDSQIEISGQPAHLIANLKLPRDTNGNVTGDVSLTGLGLKALGRNATAFAFLTPFDLKADVTGSFVFDHGTRLRYADLGIGAAGAVNGLGAPLKVRSLKLVARYDGLTGQLLVDDASLEGDHARAHLTGRGKLDFDANNVLTLATLDLNADRFSVNLPGVVTQSVALGRIAMHTVYTPAIQKIDIQKLDISGGPMNAQLAAAVTLGNNTSPAIAANGTIAAMNVRDLLRYWPIHVGEGAREWINDNISAGRIGPIALHSDIKTGELDQSALPESAMNISVPLSNATVTFVHQMSPMENVQGVATLTGDTFKATIASGNVGAIKVSNGSVVIPQLHMHGPTGVIDARIAGTVPDLLTLLDQKPLQYPTRFHISPAMAKGTAVADLSVRVPMLRDLNADNIGISAKVATQQFSIALGSRTKISNGTVNFDVTNDRLHAVGTVALGGAPLGVDWVEDFKTKGDITTTIQAKGLVDEATRDALNFHAGDIISGPVSVNALILGHHGDLRRANMTMDLTPTTVSMDIVNYRKAPGVPATAQMSAQFADDGGINSETMTITGAGLNVRGTINFGANGDLARVDLPMVRAGANNDFAIVYSDTVAGGLDVNVRGHSADGTGLGRRKAAQVNNSPPETPRNPAFHYSIHLDRVVMRDNVSLSNFSLDTAGAGTSPQTLSLSSSLGKSKIAGSITPSAEGRHVALTSDDTGSLLKGLFGFESMKGGDLNVNATLSPVAQAKSKSPLDYAGTVVITDFKITNQPFLARLFAAGSLLGVVDLLRGEGITFDKFEVPFRAQNDSITIHDARAAGPALGITADGYIDRAHNQIALKGTLAPVYGLNSVLGAIPILGDVFVSKKGEGIIGMTYSVSGDADQPSLSVNPLSALAPGIFRRIFEGSMPVAPQPAAPAQPSQAGTNQPPTPPQQ